MMKAQSSPDISQLRKNRHLRIHYEHRYTPGEVKKQLSAEDVILGRYKYIPPITLAERERTRMLIRSNRRPGVVVGSDHSNNEINPSTLTLPPIGLHHQQQRRESTKNGIRVAGDKSDSQWFGVQDGRHQSEIPKHPVIVFDIKHTVNDDGNGFVYDKGEDRIGSYYDDSKDVSRTRLAESSKDTIDDDGDDDNGAADSGESRLSDRKDSGGGDDDGGGDVIDDGDGDDDGDDNGGAISDGSDSEYKKYREKLKKRRILTSPDFDTDLELSDRADGDEYTGLHRRKKKFPKSVRTYYRSCSKCHVTPNKSFVRQCGKGTVDLRHRLLTHVEVRPIAIALVNEHRTSFLNISMNPLGPIGTGCLAQVLLQNTSIVELNLSSTYPQRAGLESLVRCLERNKTLRRLYLENNELQPSEGDVIARLIEGASSLLELHLGNNNLGFGGTNDIARALVLAKGKLKVLNLRYNNIRTDSAVILAHAIAKNKTLQTLDVSWNGFGEAGCKALASSLEKNTSLKQLDLKCNRIGLKSLPSLIRGITKNRGLNSFSVSSNPLTTEGAKALLSALLTTKTPTLLTQLDLTGIPVDQEFLLLKDRLEECVPLRVVHEETVSLGTSDMSKASTGTFLDNYDPVMTMFEFMKKDNLRVIDMFQFFDIQKRDKLSKSDFAAGFKTLNIPFTKYQIEVIVKALDANRDGFVSLDEMVKGYNKNDKTVKSRRIKASMKKTTDMGLETLWAYIKTLISKRKDDNAKKNAIKSQARRNDFLSESTPINGNNSVSPGGDSRKTSRVSVSKKQSVVSLPRHE